MQIPWYTAVIRKQPNSGAVAPGCEPYNSAMDFRIASFREHITGVADNVPALVAQLAASDFVSDRSHLADQPDECQAVRGDSLFLQPLEDFFRAKSAHQPENGNDHPLAIAAQ